MRHHESTVAARAPSAPRHGRLALIVPSAVALATLGLLAWSAWPVVRPAREVEVTQAVFDRAAAAPDQIEHTDSDKREIPTVQAAGWLEAEPFYVAAAALADGVVESMDVLEGDRVEKGQVVARLVAEDSEIRLRVAEADLANARAERSRMQAELEAAERAWDDPVELERAVEAGRAAVAEAEAEHAQLPSLIESARATLVRLDEELSRAEESRSSGAATELAVIIAKQRVAAQRADVTAIEAREPLLASRVERLRAELRAAERDLDLRIEDRRRVDATRAAVASADAAVARAEARRDEAALELERMVIRAPIGGYVQARLKLPGDKVVRMMDSQHSAHLVHLYDPERLQVRVDVPLADAAHVYVGQRCEVVVEVLPDRVFAGEVLRTTHLADLQKNTLEIKVKVIDPAPILRPEMLTRVKFLPPGRATEVGSSRDAVLRSRVLLPESAIDESSGRSRVWTVTDRRSGKGVIRARAVEAIERSDGWVTIEGEVQPGALVAIGAEGVRDGERVSIRRAETGGGS
ncbi:MAG: hypothetical protein CMJ31_08320 [Phycisphaerae bacterium]|nr:hypothetical protein [Phycisphaerae bacterium]